MRKTKKAKATLLKKLFRTSPKADENSPMKPQTSRTILNSARGNKKGSFMTDLKIPELQY